MGTISDATEKPSDSAHCRHQLASPSPRQRRITPSSSSSALKPYSITGESGGSSGAANVEAHLIMMVHWHAPVNSLGCATFSFHGILNSLLVLWLLVCSGNEAAGEEAGHVSQTHAATLGYKLHEPPGKSRTPPPQSESIIVNPPLPRVSGSNDDF